MFTSQLHHRHRHRLNLPPALNRAFDELSKSLHRYRESSSRAIDELATSLHKQRRHSSRALNELEPSTHLRDGSTIGANSNASAPRVKDPSATDRTERKVSSVTDHTDSTKTKSDAGVESQIETKIEKSRSKDVMAIGTLIAVFADGLNLQCCAPNYPLMVTPGIHPDSFPSVPFDMNTSLYMLNGVICVGLVVSNFLFGTVVARELGSRIALIILMLGSVLMTTLKYFFRGSYYAYLALAFLNALFGSSITVGSGYMCVLFNDDRAKADKYVGYVFAAAGLSRTLGGALTLAFQSSLFLALWPAAAFNMLAFFVVYMYVEDPQGVEERSEHSEQDNKGGTQGKEKALEEDRGEHSEQDGKGGTQGWEKALVILGATLNSFGSAGFMPLAFATVLYETFLLDPVEEGETAIMSENQYRLIYTLVALTGVLPSVALPYFFKKIGPVSTCIAGNISTVVSLVAIILVIRYPATSSSFALVVGLIYIGAPFVFGTNLSWPPMLDRCSSTGEKMKMQGIIVTVYDLGSAVFPLALGVCSDRFGFELALWICVGVSFFSALVTVPLYFSSVFKTKEDLSDD